MVVLWDFKNHHEVDIPMECSFIVQKDSLYEENPIRNLNTFKARDTYIFLFVKN